MHIGQFHIGEMMRAIFKICEENDELTSNSNMFLARDYLGLCPAANFSWTLDLSIRAVVSRSNGSQSSEPASEAFLYTVVISTFYWLNETLPHTQSCTKPEILGPPYLLLYFGHVV